MSLAACPGETPQRQFFSLPYISKVFISADIFHTAR